MHFDIVVESQMNLKDVVLLTVSFDKSYELFLEGGVFLMRQNLL